MSPGTLYSNFRIRNAVPRVLIKHFKLDVKIVDPATEPQEFAKKFPLQKYPSFYDDKGFRLTEAMAINYYLIQMGTDQKLKRQLLGPEDDLKTQAQIIRWESLTNSDLIFGMADTFKPLLGEFPYNKKSVDDAFKQVNKIADLFEARLKEYTYLATESISLADLVGAAAFVRGFEYLFGKEWREQHPSIVRWFNTVRNSEFFSDEFQDFKFTDKMLEPPKNAKKEKKQQQPAAEKKEKKPAAESSSEPAPEKKAKHPLEALGKSTFVLDEWKRKYSNEETREGALPWFWANYNPEEYSLWKVDYKYNDELTLTFMSNNLVGGFFNRLSGSIKYMFGCLVVYGENNANGIVGAVMLRGQDPVPAFNVAPDWESYSFTKLDHTKQEDKEFIENMWAWDKPVMINGEAKEIADGKVLK